MTARRPRDGISHTNLNLQVELRSGQPDGAAGFRAIMARSVLCFLLCLSR